MKKMVTLNTIVWDGLRSESFEYDYIVNVPTSYMDKPIDMQSFCEKVFRKAALGTLIGSSCEEILRNTRNDYNWGDFVQYYNKKELAQFGICQLEDYDGAFSKDMVSPRVVITVNHDEILLPNTLACDLIVCEEGKEPMRIIDCELYDSASYRIDYPEEADYIKNIKNASICVDFGNGVEHCVARTEEEQEKNDITFVLEPHAACYSINDDDFLVEKNNDIDNSVYNTLVAASMNKNMQKYVQIAVNHLSNASYIVPVEMTEEIVAKAKEILEAARWTENGNLEWDMHLVGNLEFFIECELNDAGVSICHPWYDEDERVCCSTDERCKHCTRPCNKNEN